MLPRAVVVAVVSHVPIIVVVLGPIRSGIVAVPAMILMSTVVIAITVTNADVSEIDCDACARHSGSRNGYRRDCQTCCQQSRCEQFHWNITFRMPLGV